MDPVPIQFRSYQSSDRIDRTPGSSYSSFTSSSLDLLLCNCLESKTALSTVMRLLAWAHLQLISSFLSLSTYSNPSDCMKRDSLRRQKQEGRGNINKSSGTCIKNCVMIQPGWGRRKSSVIRKSFYSSSSSFRKYMFIFLLLPSGRQKPYIYEQ